MSPARLRHRVMAVRVDAGGRTESGYTLAVHGGPRGARARMAGAPPPPRALGAAADRAFGSLAAALPPSRRGALEVEAGCVRQGGDHGSPVRARPYLLALSGGCLLHLGRGHGGRTQAPWSGETDAGGLDAALPVLLGPCAVLALAELLLEAGATLPPPLRASRRAGSPYPPHDPPSGFAADGEAWVAGLLARPELWCTPFGALPTDELGTVAVTASAAAPPDGGVVVDWLLPLTGDARAAEWEAGLTLLRDGRRVAVAPASVRLRADAAALLASSRGAAGRTEPALRRDPFRGDRYGTAPPLATRTPLGALREGGR